MFNTCTYSNNIQINSSKQTQIGPFGLVQGCLAYTGFTVNAVHEQDSKNNLLVAFL